MSWEPGWRWSKDGKPVVQTESCQNRHVGYVLSGSLHVVMDDGSELDIRAGDAFEIAGHDAWVVGDEPWDTVEFASAAIYGATPDANESVLATILFTDIVDSTARLSLIGDVRWRSLLLQHNQAMRAQIDRYRGREVGTTGDGFLALSMELSCRPVCEGDDHRRRRPGHRDPAGLHTGEVVIAGGQARGLAVHAAARVSALAGPGEVLVSSTTRDLLDGSGLAFVSRGEHELKGLIGARTITPSRVPTGTEEADGRDRSPHRPMTFRSAQGLTIIDPDAKEMTMKLTASMMLTVDGVYQGPGGPDEDRRDGFERGGWTAAHADEETGRFLTSWFERADALLLGRRTWSVRELLAAPRRRRGRSGLARHQRPPQVRAVDHAQGSGLEHHVIDGDVEAAIRELKAKPGREFQVHGSGELLRWLLERDLVDELNLRISPVVVGDGRRLFPEHGQTHDLELVESRSTPKGVMLLTYRPPGGQRSPTPTSDPGGVSDTRERTSPGRHIDPV